MERMVEAARDVGTDAKEIAPDLAYLRTAIVNVYFFGQPGGNWVLVDAGVVGSAGTIRKAAEQRFGPGARPSCIVLTHGHFDHVGALRDLAEHWDVPVYAHVLELPYLTGRSSYPPPDPTVGGGMMARLSWAYPRGPIDLGERVRALPGDSSVPGMPHWRWIHTPGHTAGHVSLFRDSDRVLIAGDAFITTNQESAFAVAVQRKEVHGPPKYYTQDWQAAGRSVRDLAALGPAVAATGHGVPLAGEAMLAALRNLALRFEQIAVPDHGRYVDAPVLAGRSGTVYVPPRLGPPVGRWVLVAGLVALGVVLVARARRED